MWDDTQIELHQKAANKLDQIMQATFRFIRQNRQGVTEYQTTRFIRQRIASNGLVSEKDNPIVAFGTNTSHIHYFAGEKSSKILRAGDLVMIDLWARLDKKGAPYADITWMGVKDQSLGPKRSCIFNHLIDARNIAVASVRKALNSGSMPISGSIDIDIRDFFGTIGMQSFFLHTTGHPLGLNSAHGRGKSIWHKNTSPIRVNVGYTIEPGLYFENDFGMRSEIDFYIDKNLELHITTTPQQKIVLI